MTEELKQPNIPASNPEYMTEEQVRGIFSESLSKFAGIQRVLSGNIQSGNFITGSTGWALNALGNLEANSGNFRGDISAATGTFGNLKINPSTAPNAIIVNDGTNDRVLIGYLAGKF